MLGSTFEYVFRTQMEALQDGDRLYYLPRIEGMDYEELLQDSSLAQLIRANTGIKHLPGNIFLTPEYTDRGERLLRQERRRHVSSMPPATRSATSDHARPGCTTR